MCYQRRRMTDMVLNKMNMVDYAMDIHKSLYHTEDVPQDMVERRAEAAARLKALEERVAPLISFLQNSNAVQELRHDKHYNLQMLHDRYQIRLRHFISMPNFSLNAGTALVLLTICTSTGPYAQTVKGG